MKPYLIAHACGQVADIFYSNSLDALNNSYNYGYSFIEFDISKTSDGKLVLVHDFLETRYKLFGKKGSCSFAEFMSDKMRGGYQQLSLDMLVDWFTEHDDCFLVTDSKDVDVVELCCYILNRAPILKERLIVQIFSFAEYQKIKNLGISKIIFATYKTSANNSEIINFLQKNPCYAVSMSLARAEEGFALEIKDKIDVWILAFTLNKFDLVTHYKKLGVDGFFTDKILPS